MAGTVLGTVASELNKIEKNPYPSAAHSSSGRRKAINKIIPCKGRIKGSREKYSRQREPGAQLSVVSCIVMALLIVA